MSIVVPVLNEAAKIRFVLRQLPAVHEVNVVDGASGAAVGPSVAQALPEAVVLSRAGSSRAEAIAAGVAVATGDIIATLPVNGTVDPATLPSLIDALVAGADVAKGSRFLPGAGSAEATLLDTVSSLVLARMVRRRTGARLSDPAFGYVAFWADQRALLGLEDRPAWTEGDGPALAIVVRALAAGATVVEVPVVERHRLFGGARPRGMRMLARRLRDAHLEDRLRRRAVAESTSGLRTIPAH